MSSERRLIAALDSFVRRRKKGARTTNHVVPLVEFAAAELRARGVPTASIHNEFVTGFFYGRRVDLVVTNQEHVVLTLLVLTQSGSVYNNLHNRCRDILGDALNLRVANPDAHLGFVYLIRADVEATKKRRSGTSAIEEIATFLSKLQGFPGLHGKPLLDAAALVAVDCDAHGRIHTKPVPDDVDVLKGFFDKLAVTVKNRQSVPKRSPQ